MIDVSQIKNKAKVVVEKLGEDITCEVIDTTHLTCTIVLPDGSQQQLAKTFVKQVIQETSPSVVIQRDVDATGK